VTNETRIDRLRRRADRFVARVFAVAEGARSPRALALAFMALAGVLASSTWLRPAFSPDIKGCQLPLRLGPSPDCHPEELLYGPRPSTLLSPGGIVLAVIAAAAIAVAYRPEWFPTAAGSILACAIAANAVVALNYPGLIELLDHEYEQRLQVSTAFATRRTQEDSMATRDNARVGPWAAITADEQRGDPARGWAYLYYGVWLAALVAAGVLIANPRSIPRRFVQLAFWIAVGSAFSAVACWPRLRGEAQWREAVRLDAIGDLDGAAEALAGSCTQFPELGNLERAWLLAGKIDQQRGRSTPEATSFRIYQLMRDKRRPRGVAYATDLPWQIRRVNDLREGLSNLPSGFDMGLDAGGIGVWTSNRRIGIAPAVPGPGLLANVNRDRELDQARHLCDDLLATEAGNRPAVRKHVGRTFAEIGLETQLGNLLQGDEGRVPSVRSRMLATARLLWLDAAWIDPHRFDTSYYLGVGESMGGAAPEQVRAAFMPLLRNAVDRPLQADALCEIGDAYLRAGRLEEARPFYVESYDLFNIPEQHKNYRAQRRLGGL
jgi:tetratricopeptide (TPR) repeat protein